MSFVPRLEIRELVRVLLEQGIGEVSATDITLELRQWLATHIPNAQALIGVALAATQGTDLYEPLREQIASVPELILKKEIGGQLKLLKGGSAA